MYVWYTLNYTFGHVHSFHQSSSNMNTEKSENIEVALHDKKKIVFAYSQAMTGPAPRGEHIFWKIKIKNIYRQSREHWIFSILL